MNMQQVNSFVLIPEVELQQLKLTQVQILEQLQNLQEKGVKQSSLSNHITAMEFMKAVRICRSKFDKLVASSKIKTVKKKRKIYVPLSEIDRYFLDASIQ